MLVEITEYLKQRIIYPLAEQKIGVSELRETTSSPLDDRSVEFEIKDLTVTSILYIFSLEATTVELQKIKDKFLKEAKTWLDTGNVGQLIFYEWVLLQKYLQLTSNTFHFNPGTGATTQESLLAINPHVLSCDGPLQMSDEIRFGENGRYNPSNCRLVYGDKIANFNFFIDGPVLLLLLKNYNQWINLQCFYELMIRDKHPTPKRINELIAGIRIKFKKARIPLFIYNITGHAYMLSNETPLKDSEVITNH